MANPRAPSAAHSLYVETEAARTLLSQFKDVLGEDIRLKSDAIEGETNLLETVARAVARVIELEAMEAALDIVEGNLKARKARFAEQQKNLRTALTVALEVAEKPKLETPWATVSLHKIPPKAEVVDEPVIPSRFFKPQEPKLDKAALAKALKSGEVVPGARMDNGGLTVALTVR